MFTSGFFFFLSLYPSWTICIWMVFVIKATVSPLSPLDFHVFFNCSIVIPKGVLSNAWTAQICHWLISYVFVCFSTLQPTSAPVRSWAGATKPSRSGRQRRVTLMESSCTRRPRSSSFSVRGMIRSGSTPGVTVTARKFYLPLYTWYHRIF